MAEASLGFYLGWCLCYNYHSRSGLAPYYGTRGHWQGEQGLSSHSQVYIRSFALLWSQM